jgi:nucleotide-binding universal stress UspA family protein
MDLRLELDDRLGQVRLRHLVVAEDSSPASQEGLAAAVRLASWTGARVTVVHVRHLSPLACAGLMNEWVVQDGFRTLDSLADDARSRATAALTGTGVRWDFQVRTGRPGREILRTAEEVGADLVVIGSNRHSTFHNELVGSTTAYVTAHASMPVVVVRPLQPLPALLPEPLPTRPARARETSEVRPRLR